ncbi:RNA polymerase sigma-70 factor (ECF subfamily) [Endobacter medicaginis]|uniref:RNA polymerase sigma-70 factor (ECF subfamily) n=2 Tax=Endobacter medicaginis TaxID=1181271 RepID=A0A839V0C5_9PROT|nr:sigma-70 family RNA polymerase sigma factor [Endobacter medicaginis]MBB3172981.1 RNA polymerase sigma-70 factor (ECF subfamily) [Endobacter medicaginis]MCX5475239.1 sigma-70 family RNA polymerase sigma factor [Endobacter medicaginis]
MGHDTATLSPRPLDDALRAVARGDRAAFEELYRLTSAQLFGVCLRILPARAEAEDVLQDAYLSIWRRAASFDAARGSAMAWLITLTRNRAIDRLRARGVARETADATGLVETVVDPAPLASDLIETGQAQGRLAECLDQLETGDAGLIRTAFFEGLSYAGLAERIETPLGTVKSRIRRALLKLRACLQ